MKTRSSHYVRLGILALICFAASQPPRAFAQTYTITTIAGGDYTYAAVNLGTLAAMSSPAPGSTLSGSSVTFTWAAGSGASAYWLDVGTVQGQGNISAGQLASSVTNETVSSIPTNGGTIYVRL